MKQFLERNKIYFEVVMSVILAIMAILVAWQANSIADSQAIIAEEANRIAILEHIPDVEIEFRHIKTNSGIRTEHLIVINKGKPLYEFESYALAFLSLKKADLVDIDDPSKNFNERLSMMIPIKNYYPNVILYPNNNIGEILRQEVSNVNKMEDMLERFNSLMAANNKAVINSIKRYIRVSYADARGEQYIKYFKFGVGGDGIPVSVDEGMSIYSLSKHLAKAEQVIDFNSATSDQLLSLWEKNKEPI